MIRRLDFFSSSGYSLLQKPIMTAMKSSNGYPKNQFLWDAYGDHENKPVIGVPEFASFLDDDNATTRSLVRTTAADRRRRKQQEQEQQQSEYDRSLKDKQIATLDPTTLPPTTIAPSTGDINDNNENHKNDSASKRSEPSSGLSILWWIVLVVAILIIGRICYQRFRRRQERLLSNYRSAQADRVLGDMQMVPNADLDDTDDHDIL